MVGIYHTEKYIENSYTWFTHISVSLAGFRWPFNSVLGPFWGSAIRLSILGVAERNSVLLDGSTRIFPASQGKNSPKSSNNPRVIWLDYICHLDHH